VGVVVVHEVIVFVVVVVGESENPMGIFSAATGLGLISYRRVASDRSYRGKEMRDSVRPRLLLFLLLLLVPLSLPSSRSNNNKESKTRWEYPSKAENRGRQRQYKSSSSSELSSFV
jgi:branched-subunit amino acid ABC-type transport system permease component